MHGSEAMALDPASRLNLLENGLSEAVAKMMDLESKTEQALTAIVEKMKDADLVFASYKQQADLHEQATKSMVEPMKKMELPDVPSTELPSIKNATKEEEAELKQLEAELAGL